MIDRKTYQLLTGGNAQFVEDHEEIKLNVVYAKPDALGYFLVGVARNHPRNNIELAPGQSKFILRLLLIHFFAFNGAHHLIVLPGHPCQSCRKLKKDGKLFAFARRFSYKGVPL
jgi:hypothetical protein